MTNYYCECCNYRTIYQPNMTRHYKSDKHISNSKENDENGDKKHECNMCHKTFGYKSGLSRHKKTCLVKNNETVLLKNQIAELQSKNEMQEMRYKMEKMELELKNKQDKIELLLSFKNIAENTAETSKTSCSALNYIIKHYNNAPCIQEFTKFELLTKGNADYSIAEIVIHKYNYGELCSYIGDIIVGEYKTDDPSKQALWSSDVNRLAYLIREVTANNKVEWLTDKGGIKISTYVIKPILDHIHDDLTRYYNEKLDDLDSDIEETEKTAIRKNMTSTASIQKIITNNNLNDDIIKYIANFLHLDRKNNIKLIKHED